MQSDRDPMYSPFLANRSARPHSHDRAYTSCSTPSGFGSNCAAKAKKGPRTTTQRSTHAPCGRTSSITSQMGELYRRYDFLLFRSEWFRQTSISPLTSNPTAASLCVCVPGCTHWRQRGTFLYPFSPLTDPSHRIGLHWIVATCEFHLSKPTRGITP